MDNKIFYRNIEEKHASVVELLNRYFVAVISTHPQDKKIAALSELGKATELLVAQMAKADCPIWLDELNNTINKNIGSCSNSHTWKNIFDKVKNEENAIRNHKWFNAESEAIPIIDFDEIVEKYRNKETVKQLFQSLIQSLEKLIQCEELDSRKVAMDLERLLASLRKSETGTFNAQLISFSVTKKYIKNLGKAWLKETKTAKVMIKAAEDTMDELGLTLDEASEKIKSEISQVEDKLNQRLIESAPKSTKASDSEDLTEIASFIPINYTEVISLKELNNDDSKLLVCEYEDKK